MKKSLIVVSSILLAAMLVACESESTSTTSVNVTTTTDEGTTEYNYASEDNNGEVTTTETVTETPADGAATEETTSEDTEEDSVNYEVVNGSLELDAPSKDDYWMEVITFENTTKLTSWDVKDQTYYATVDANISSGRGYVILGAYDDPEGTPYTYLIIIVNIEDGKIANVEDVVGVDSLEEFFPVFESGFVAVDDKGNDVILLAFYGDADSDYVWVYDGTNGQTSEYNVTPSTVTDSEGVTFDSSKITVGELEMEYLEIEGRNFVLIDDVLYETETITEDEVLALQEQ